MVRKILASSLAVLAAGQVDLSSLGANTACRSSTDSAQHCRESSTQSCRDKYQVLTQISEADCKMVCETLAATCTGVEYKLVNQDVGRCEIWSVPIEDTFAANGFECFEDTDNSTGTDGMLYTYFQLEMPTLDPATASLAAGAIASSLVNAMKQNIRTVYGTTSSPSLVNGLKFRHIDIMLNLSAPIADVYLTPPAGVSPLTLYQVLRPAGSDFNDGTVPITTALQNNLTSTAQMAEDLAQDQYNMTILKDGETSLTVQIKPYSRRLKTTNPLAPTPAPTPSPTPRNVSAAGGSRFAVVAFLVAAIAAVAAQ